MTSPSYLEPFYFSWVDSDQHTFDPATMSRIDEDIFDFELKHEEGHYATLDLVVQNPRIGLLAPGRKVWCWFAYDPPGGSGVIPLFHGILIGIPDDMLGEKITLKFIAQPQTYLLDKQAVAETLKVRPYYDPIFLSDDKRDDPDAILEGWSALYHIDRTTLETSVSDILVGEDGTITFDGDMAFYNSVHQHAGESALTDIQVQASVQWTQRCLGSVIGPPVNLQSYTGESWLHEWPKPGHGLGGGWTVETSFVTDVYQIAQTPMVKFSGTSKFVDPEAGDCSVNSTHMDGSFPALLSADSISGEMTASFQTGFCDPGVMTVNPEMHSTGVLIPKWTINTVWSLRYEAQRQFTELLVMDIKANTQPVLTSPTIAQITEVLKLHGADVGQPLIDYDAWSDFADRHVPLAMIVHPNNPSRPGGLSYQVCVQAGTAGAAEPNFSDIPGTLTTDGGVIWASMGEQPLTDHPQWMPATPVPLGEIIGYSFEAFNQKTGEMEKTGAFAFYLCTRPGRTNAQQTEITYIPPFTASGEATPAPQQFFYIAGPAFSATPGAIINDGTVQWTSLGTAPAFMAIPIGGTSVNVTARCYFPTDRGRQSVEYLIAKARARLRKRARTITISWDCPIEHVLGMSCRKNAALYDPRIPGGAAIGKVTHYGMSAKDGRILGHVQIGVSVGYGGSVPAVDGTPTYVQNGYVAKGYQQYDGASYTLGDISYTAPRFSAFDDGLSFPLRKLPIIAGGFSGSTAAQKVVIQEAIIAQRHLENLSMDMQGLMQATGLSSGQLQVQYFGSAQQSAWILEQAQKYWTAKSLPYVMEANPVSWTIEIHPVTNGPFNGAYNASCSMLEMPIGIDLAAPSDL